ncbi:MAG: sensor histidine kinase [Pseudomonadota bacterium]
MTASFEPWFVATPGSTPGVPPSRTSWIDPPKPEHRSALDVLEATETDRLRLGATERALLNILEDFGAEKSQQEATQKAMLNILDDLAAEKRCLEQTQRYVVRSELAARALLREKDTLVKEIHHRVKNNLQVISSLLNLQARTFSDPTMRAAFNASQNRVQAIALVHEKLYQSATLSHIDFAEHIVSVVDSLFSAYDASERGITREYDLTGPPLAIDLAIPCGLIVNELVSNCLKHAFRDRVSGAIRICFRRRAALRVELTIADDGIGLPRDIEPRSTETLGLDLVFTFAEQIAADVAVERLNGTTFRLSFPEGGANE